LGFKVIATGSAKSTDLIKAVGADEVVDYKIPEADQIADIVAKTGGKVFKVLDATAQNIPTSDPLFKATVDGEKRFTSTNDWTPHDTHGAFQFDPISLGPIGQPGAALNDSIESFIPFVYRLIEAGKITPAETVLIGKGGVQDAIDAYAFQTAGKGGSKKVIIKVTEP